MVDASQGVEAQTLANAYLAINNRLEIIPVINKIDLPSADVERTKEMIEGAVGLDASDAVLISRCCVRTGRSLIPGVKEQSIRRTGRQITDRYNIQSRVCGDKIVIADPCPHPAIQNPARRAPQWMTEPREIVQPFLPREALIEEGSGARFGPTSPD